MEVKHKKKIVNNRNRNLFCIKFPPLNIVKGYSTIPIEKNNKANESFFALEISGVKGGFLADKHLSA
jgi:hypothetical protein